jgi:metal-responsive CopG/Arc/MetJ family transcriptional regulator
MDQAVEEQGYTSRQEFIRETIRQVLIERKKQEVREVLARLRKKIKVKATSPLLTKKEKDEVAQKYLKKRGFSHLMG